MLVAGQLEDEVDLEAVARAEERQGRSVSGVREGLGDLGHHGGFEEGALHGAVPELLCVAVAGEEGRQAAVQHVELRGLDETLGGGAREGHQALHDAARLEHRGPAAGGGGRDTAVPGELRVAQELGAARGAEPQEALEGLEVPDLHELADVALEVRLEVARHPQPQVDPAVQARLGEGTPEQLAGGARARFVGELGRAQPEEVQDGGAAREALRRALHEREALRACQDPLAGPPVSVDAGLQVGEELGRVLDLVEDPRRRVRGEEGARILERRGPDVGILQRGEPERGAELLADQRRLARLAGSGDHHGGEVARARRRVSARARGRYTPAA